MINAMVQGAKTGWILSQPKCTENATVSDLHKFRFEWQGGCPPAVFVYQYTATAFILMGLVVSIVIYPVHAPAWTRASPTRAWHHVAPYGAGAVVGLGRGQSLIRHACTPRGCFAALAHPASRRPRIQGGPLRAPPLVQVIYHGLLSIGVMLANPLGTECIDFPGSFYQHIMKAECEGFRSSADAIQISKRAKGSRWWPGIGL